MTGGGPVQGKPQSRTFGEYGTSAVEEAGREDPTLGSPDAEGRAGRLEGKYCSRVEEEEGEGGGSAPRPLPHPGREEEEEDLVDM